MKKQTLNNPCALNCAVDFIGICLNLNIDGVLSKAVKRSATNTTLNLTTHLIRAGIWLILNLLHIVISFNLYPPLHTLLLCPYSSGVFPMQINRGEHGYKGDNQ
jgi:hypothetical protein